MADKIFTIISCGRTPEEALENFNTKAISNILDGIEDYVIKQKILEPLSEACSNQYRILQLNENVVYFRKYSDYEYELTGIFKE